MSNDLEFFSSVKSNVQKSLIRAKSRTDYEFRSLVIKDYSLFNDVLKGAKKYSYHNTRLAERYLGQDDVEYYSMSLAKYEPYALALEELFSDYEPIFNEFDKINDADKKRRQRLRKRINMMFLQGNCFFVTLTFNDEVLDNTDYHERRVMVTRFLKSVSCQYVGNVDFGSKNGREHFHAVIQSNILDDIKYIFTKKYGWICSDCVQFSNWSKNGFYSIKSCGNGEDDIKKLGAYVSKLTNHAIKETTKRNALIYSR